MWGQRGPVWFPGTRLLLDTRLQREGTRLPQGLRSRGAQGFTPASSRLGCKYPCPSLLKGFCLCLMTWLQIHP